MNGDEMRRAIIDEAQAAGIAEYDIYETESESVSVETLQDEISSLSSSANRTVCFRCIVDGKMGASSSERFSREDARDLVRRAAENAKCIDSTDEVFIFPGSPSYEKPHDPDFRMPETALLRDAALTLQKNTYAESEKVTDGTQSGAFGEISSVRLTNSRGLSLSHTSGACGGYVNVIVRDGEEAEEHFEHAVGDLVGNPEIDALPARTVGRALEKIGAATVESGKYAVLFDGKQFGRFLAVFSSAFSAKSAQNGLSCLAGKEGSAVAAACVTITDDPMREGNPMKMPFDGEGVATRRRTIVKDGVLCTLLYDLTTAHKAGVESTGNGRRSGSGSSVSISPYNFSIAAGKTDRDSLLAAVGDGIFITDCKGFHAGANAVTGDFSIESAGFRVRNGKRAEPIKSFTVAGNFFDLLRTVAGLGDAVHWTSPASLTAFGSPDVLFRDVSIAGK